MGEGNSLIDDFSLNSAEFDSCKNGDLKKRNEENKNQSSRALQIKRPAV